MGAASNLLPAEMGAYIKDSRSAKARERQEAWSKVSTTHEGPV